MYKIIFSFICFFSLSVHSFNLKGQVKSPDFFKQFLPSGYIIQVQIFGDLNNDQVNDCVLLIKGTDNANIVETDSGEKLDRNRRGIVVLLNRNNKYEVVAKNYQCFSSENEDGGVYFPPELTIEIKKNKLNVHYAHGRYGYWQYMFRYQNANFELIGYDISNGGAVIESATSINFLTKKKQEKVNVNSRAKGGDEVFKETWKNISINKLIKLSDIENFDELEFSSY
jgi:hypothetical protein